MTAASRADANWLDHHRRWSDNNLQDIASEQRNQEANTHGATRHRFDPRHHRSLCRVQVSQRELHCQPLQLALLARDLHHRALRHSVDIWIRHLLLPRRTEHPEEGLASVARAVRVVRVHTGGCKCGARLLGEAHVPGELGAREVRFRGHPRQLHRGRDGTVRDLCHSHRSFSARHWRRLLLLRNLDRVLLLNKIALCIEHPRIIRGSRCTMNTWGTLNCQLCHA